MSVKALVWVACTATLAGGIYACSGTSADDTVGDAKDGSVSDDAAAGDDASGGGNDSGTTKDTGAAGDTGTADDGGLTQADLACIQSADAAACDPCCNAAHNNGGDKFFDYQLACACEPTRCDQPMKKGAPYGGCGPSVCKDGGGGAPSVACNKCLNYEFSEMDGSAGDAGCLPVVFGKCGNDPDCFGYLKCAINCP